jgi:hypothetical protein
MYYPLRTHRISRLTLTFIKALFELLFVKKQQLSMFLKYRLVGVTDSLTFPKLFETFSYT